MSPSASESSLHAALRAGSHALAADDDMDAVLRDIGDASLVLLGEATHGTREFYRLRTLLSQRLITEKGFVAIAVEADWPDALCVQRYIQSRQRHGRPQEERKEREERQEGLAPPDVMDAMQALREFRRFPLWMWRNPEILQLIDWLRRHNAGRSPPQQVGFFGLDLYSLRSAMTAVLRYLARIDPEAEQRARQRYACFDQAGHALEHPQQYGYAASFGMRPDCEREVVAQLVELQRDAATLLLHDGPEAEDDWFYAEQNARVACSAEAYYRAMFGSRNASWNLRDTHMADTLDALRTHLGRTGCERSQPSQSPQSQSPQSKSPQSPQPAKIIVWAHNSHIGDARATEMGEDGQCNLGQLVRERHGMQETYLLGFTTHAGSVTAASEWDGPPEHKTVLPSMKGSIERLLHDTGLPRAFLPRSTLQKLGPCLGERLERAIGVLYLPQTERWSHYFHTDIRRQFDGVLHVDHTHALPPLDAAPHWHRPELPDTYPSGI